MRSMSMQSGFAPADAGLCLERMLVEILRGGNYEIRFYDESESQWRRFGEMG